MTETGTVYTDISIRPEWKITSMRKGHTRTEPTGNPSAQNMVDKLRKALRKKFGEKIEGVMPHASSVLPNGWVNPSEIIVECSVYIVDEVHNEADTIIEKIYKGLEI